MSTNPLLMDALLALDAYDRVEANKTSGRTGVEGLQGFLLQIDIAEQALPNREARPDGGRAKARSVAAADKGQRDAGEA